MAAKGLSGFTIRFTYAMRNEVMQSMCSVWLSMEGIVCEENIIYSLYSWNYMLSYAGWFVMKHAANHQACDHSFVDSCSGCRWKWKMGKSYLDFSGLHKLICNVTHSSIITGAVCRSQDYVFKMSLSWRWENFPRYDCRCDTMIFTG